jgi:hypothetical protein
MSEWDFDQTPTGWRSLAHTQSPEGFQDAYDAIRIRTRKWDETSSLPKSVPLWHAAQMAAFAGNERKAARIMGRKSLRGDPNWNNYVSGTKSFLTGDKVGLQKAAINTLRQPGEDANKKILMKLLAGMGKGESYSQAYGG